MATAPIRPIEAPGNQAACPSELPRAGVEAVGPHGIYVWLGEASRSFSSVWAPRPKSFELAPWHDLCALGGGVKTRGMTFEESGRFVVVSVVIGPEVSAPRLRELYSMLDSLRIEAAAR